MACKQLISSKVFFYIGTLCTTSLI